MNSICPQITPMNADSEPGFPAQRQSVKSADRPLRELRPVSLHELPTLEAQMLADGHSCVLPTLTMQRSGRTIGAVSFGAVCLVIPWFHTRDCKPRDSVEFIRQMEAHARDTLPAWHHGLFCVPFGKPFEPFMAKLGYQSAGTFNLGFKKVRTKWD